jgi:hypothetical protein
VIDELVFLLKIEQIGKGLGIVFGGIILSLFSLIFLVLKRFSSKLIIA